MDSIIFSAANLEAHVRETILQALPPEKTIFKEIVVLYSDPPKTKTYLCIPNIPLGLKSFINNPPDQSEGWDKIITVGDNLVAKDSEKTISITVKFLPYNSYCCFPGLSALSEAVVSGYVHFPQINQIS